jgi:hypothetical protein
LGIAKSSKELMKIGRSNSRVLDKEPEPTGMCLGHGTVRSGISHGVGPCGVVNETRINIFDCSQISKSIFLIIFRCAALRLSQRELLY